LLTENDYDLERVHLNQAKDVEELAEYLKEEYGLVRHGFGNSSYLSTKRRTRTVAVKEDKETLIYNPDIVDTDFVRETLHEMALERAEDSNTMQDMADALEEQE
jgi:hypothetical protein